MRSNIPPPPPKSPSASGVQPPTAASASRCRTTASVPASQRRRIFEKYYRIPTGDVQNVRGFGIGLYYTRLVVEKHGGTISVSPAPGGGSIFSILLPEHCRRLPSDAQDHQGNDNQRQEQ